MSKANCLYKAHSHDVDEDSLISPCFQINSDVQLKDIPTTGEEYLLKVIKERQNCLAITKCNRDYKKLAKNQSRFVKEVALAKAPDSLIPTIEWQNIQVADFSDVRLYITRLLSNKSSWPNSVKKFDVKIDNCIEWKMFFDSNDPTLTCVLGLPHTLLDRGIEVLTQMMNQVKPGETIHHKTGQWAYAFLACTRQPLLSDTTSILRNFARKCAEIRSRLDPDDESSHLAAAPLNIFICLVARYFRQHDLAD